MSERNLGGLRLRSPGMKGAIASLAMGSDSWAAASFRSQAGRTIGRPAPLLDKPELLEQAEWAAVSNVWWWADRGFCFESRIERLLGIFSLIFRILLHTSIGTFR